MLPRDWYSEVTDVAVGPGRHSLLCDAVRLSVALAEVHAPVSFHRGVQVIIRHTTGP